MLNNKFQDQSKRKELETTILANACYFDNPDFLKYLITHKVDLQSKVKATIGTTTYDGITVFDTAVIRNNVVIATILVNEGFEVRSDLIEHAASAGYMEMTSLLLSNYSGKIAVDDKTDPKTKETITKALETRQLIERGANFVSNALGQLMGEDFPDVLRDIVASYHMGSNGRNLNKYREQERQILGAVCNVSLFRRT
jgi:hypothetical protein